MNMTVAIIKASRSLDEVRINSVNQNLQKYQTMTTNAIVAKKWNTMQPVTISIIITNQNVKPFAMPLSKPFKVVHLLSYLQCRADKLEINRKFCYNTNRQHRPPKPVLPFLFSVLFDGIPSFIPLATPS